MRDYVDRPVTPLKRVTSPTWGPPPPCKKALKSQIISIRVTIVKQGAPKSHLQTYALRFLSCAHENDNYPFTNLSIVEKVHENNRLFCIHLFVFTNLTGRVQTYRELYGPVF